MDAKDFLISVNELHCAMKEAHIHAMASTLVEKMRENMEAMLPAFPYKDAKERQSDIDKMLIAYEMGVKDGITEWIKHQHNL